MKEEAAIGGETGMKATVGERDMIEEIAVEEKLRQKRLWWKSS